MKNLLKIQQKLIPEVIDIMTKRYLILREISLSEPIGRRALAANLQSGERIIRSETELLKNKYAPITVDNKINISIPIES